MRAWWGSPEWHSYEAACGLEPGERTRTLDAATWHTRIVDLTADETTLWRNLRGSYKPLINKALRTYRIGPLGPVWMVVFRWMHARVAGRVTRPLATWQMMADWVGTDRLLLIGALRETTNDDAVHLDPQAFAGFYIDGPDAYYGHAAALVDNVNHALVWVAMRELKARGVTRLEMGWQGEAQDAKGKSIEFFRTGFGGYDVPVRERVEPCV